MIFQKERVKPGKITLIDTGDDSMTGGRLKRVAPFLCDEECFCFTYGDGLSDINIKSLIEFHKAHGKEATLTSVFPPGRFGALEIDEFGKVKSFREKFNLSLSWINGGFFVLEQEVFNAIEGDSTTWEKEPLIYLSDIGELSAYKHQGFWKPCDTLREKRELEELWENNAPWKNWVSK